MKTINGNWLRRLVFIAAATIFILALFFHTREIEFVQMAYLGYVWFDMPNINLVVAFLCALLPACWLPTRINVASDLTIFFLYPAIYIPPQILGYSFFDGNSATAIKANVVLLLAFIITDLLRTYRNSVKIAPDMRNLKTHPLLSNIFWLGIALSIILVTTRTLDLHGFDLSQVYEQRMLARSESDSNFLSAYAFPLLMNGIAPFLLIAGIYTRKWRYLIFSLLAFLITFAVAGTKSSLLLIPLIGVGVFFAKYSRCHAGAWILAGFTTLILLSRYTFAQFDDVWFSAIFVRRFLFTPAAIVCDYYSFFAVNTFFYFTDVNGLGAILQFFGVASVYQTAKGFALGAWRWHNPAINMVTNAWANAYGDCGLWGIVIACIVVGFLLRFLDKRASLHCGPLVTAMSIVYGFFLSSMAIFGLVLNGGLIISLPVLWLLTCPPRKSRKSAPNAQPASAAPPCSATNGMQSQ